MAEIGTLVIADPPELWADMGFVVEGTRCWVSGIGQDLGAPGEGVIAWSLRGVDGFSELPLAGVPAPDAQPTPAHPNGVIALDHVVVATPDVERTIDAFEAVDIPLRRIREAGTPERPAVQAFFKLGETIVEVVGSPAAVEPGPARFYGLAFTVADLDATAAFLGPRLRPAKEAVQPGRRIATLDRKAGSTVALAFMSPDSRRSDP